MTANTIAESRSRGNGVPAKHSHSRGKARQVSNARVSRAATAHPRAVISSVAVFVARAEARAILWQCGEFDLHEAVDALQASAEASGLVAEIGQDAVQAIIADAFEAVR
jgi:hypothetical protein